MPDNEKFLMEIAHLTARVKAMACREFTTRMKALQIVGVEPVTA